MNRKALSLAVLLIGALGLSACNSIETEAKYPTGADRGATGGNNIYDKPDSIFGGDGLGIFGSKKKDQNDNGIGVNSYLWRASLDTVSFMPLASADPFGGVILTDWYSTAENANERYKLNVFVLGKQLRSDGIRVRVFKQVARDGIWVDDTATNDMARSLEDTILTRARQLRIAGVDD
jgi:hypothetical protein